MDLSKMSAMDWFRFGEKFPKAMEYLQKKIETIEKDEKIWKDQNPSMPGNIGHN